VTLEPYPLTNAHWKTERAKLHLDSLREEVAAFCKDSHAITVQEESELDRVRYRVELKQPHVYVFLILGDVLQCLRTALDQAVWSLIHHRTGGDPQSSEFPIFARPLNTEDRRKFNRKVKGLSDEAIAYVESIQPYNRMDGAPLSTDPLWCLHELNRIDKHRRISVRAQFAVAARHHFGLDAPREDFVSMTTERTNYGFDVVCTGSYKHLRPKVNSLVQFGEQEAGIVLTIDDIAQVYDFVARGVLIRLGGFAKKND
jgi:hypothetical protein